MRISSVNNFRNNISKTQNFNGLWGKTSLLSDEDPALGILKVQNISYYYPYKDENIKEAEMLVQGYKNACIDESTSKPRYVVNDCKLCATLPFTESEFNQYRALKKGTRLNDLHRSIHSFVERFYLNKDQGDQTPAINCNI